jgi:oligopeptide transport system permease protein
MKTMNQASSANKKVESMDKKTFPFSSAETSVDSVASQDADWKALLQEDFSPASKAAQGAALTRPSLSFWQDAWRRLRGTPQAMISLAVIVLLVLFTLLGPVFYQVDPSQQQMSRISEGPSFAREVEVVEDPGTFEEILAAGVPEVPADAPSGVDLPAPKNLALLGTPSTLAVRLKWDPVAGATGYLIYKLDGAGAASGNLGVPVATVEGGNHVSYEDRFNLGAGRYSYSVLAKGAMEESKNFVSVDVTLPTTLALEEAQKIKSDVKPGDRIQMPGHPLGTDYLGRDLLARLMAGARVSLFIGFFAPFLWILLGVLIGGIAGFYGGQIDQVLMRITDFVLALPFLLFMILFKIVFSVGAGESGVGTMLFAMVVLSWTSAARLTRGQILQLRESEFVHAARLMGGRPSYLLIKHLLPNTMGVILVSLTFAIPSAIFTEAFLSFIGMGVVPPTPSWGSMCNDGIQTFLIHPYEFFFPAVLISLTVLAFNLLGDGLRDALDPKLRSLS